MFEKFASFLGIPAFVEVPGESRAPEEVFMGALGGSSHIGGMYRVFDEGILAIWKRSMAEAYPAATDIRCLAYDWLGRVYGTDPGRLEQGLPGWVLMEIGAGLFLEAPQNIVTQHCDYLPGNWQEEFDEALRREWVRSGNHMPALNECVGYKRSLFLGGEHKTENLMLMSVDVYWTLTSQAIAQLRSAPKGTKVGPFSIDN